jgi:type IV pilus assembly protein PilO
MALSDTLEQIKNFDINEVDVNKIGVWPLPIKILVCIALVGVVFAGTYYFKIRDLNSQLQRVATQETTLRRNFEQKSFQAANLAAYREQMEEMEKSFGALLARLPSDTEVPGLLEDIDARGSESGLTINSIRLEAERQAEYYIELPISINVEGGYHDLGGFVSGVAGMPRIVTLHDYTIQSRPGSGELAMQIQARTYRYKAQEQLR